jgi:hypothetical protein
MMKKQLIALAAVFAIFAAAPAFANFSTGLISVKLGSRRGAEVSGKAVLGEDKDKWNMLEGGQGNSVAVSTTTDDLTDVKISYNSDGAFDAGDAGFADTKYGPLLRNYLHSKQASVVRITGLTPGAQYDLVVFSASNTNGRRTAFTVGKETKITTYKSDVKDLTDGVNYARFTCTADDKGVVTIYYSAGGRGDEGNINGLQLTPKPK